MKSFEQLDDDEQHFLQVLDSMIESTDEFIADDQITPDDDPEGRFADKAALEHVRSLFAAFYDLDEST